MTEQIKEKLSAFMDGETHDDHIVSQFEQDPEIRATWCRYHLIRDVMHQNYVAGATGLAERVAHALENEPTVLAPRQAARRNRVLRHASGWAIAATIAAVAILAVRSPVQSPELSPSLAVSPITQQPVRLTAEVENKLSGYLVSHNEYSASTRMKGMLPYTRIVSFAPGQSVVQRSVVNVQK